MRNRNFFLFGVSILAILFLSSMTQGAEKVFKLKYADMNPPGSCNTIVGDWWASEVEKRTGGQVKVECFWSGSLVGAYEQLSSVKRGVIQITNYLSGYHPDVAPVLILAWLPFVSTGNIKAALAANDEWIRTNSSIMEELKKNNVKYLFPYNMTHLYLWSKVPIESLDKLKGLRLRAWGLFIPFFKELGCGMVSLPVPEIYDSLERGAVDATILYISSAAGLRLPEVVKYVNVTDLGANLGCPAVMNLDTWNSLPADIQKVINGINAEAIEKCNEVSVDLYKKCMGVVKNAGLTIEKFSASDEQKLIELSKTKVLEPYIKTLDGKGIAGTQALQHYQKLLEKYSKAYGR